MIKKVNYSSRHIKSARRLPQNIQKLAIKKEKIFTSDPFDSRLNTHYLKGELDGYCAYSVNYSYRVMFKFESDTEVTFIDIGTHSIYG